MEEFELPVLWGAATELAAPSRVGAQTVNCGISRWARRILRRSPSASARRKARQPRPTPASAPPRLPLLAIEAAGVMVAAFAAGGFDAVGAAAAVPPVLGFTLVPSTPVLFDVPVGAGAASEKVPSWNWFRGISPDEACTPPRIKLNDPAPVIDPSAMSKTVM